MLSARYRSLITGVAVLATVPLCTAEERLAAEAAPAVERIPGAGPVPRKLVRRGVLQEVASPEVSVAEGYLAVFGAPALRFDYGLENFDRRHLIGLRDIRIGPEESEEELAEGDDYPVATAPGQDVPEEELTIPAVAGAPVVMEPRAEVSRSSARGRPGEIQAPPPDGLVQPLDPSTILRYFDSTPRGDGTLMMEMPFLLPYQPAPLIMESDASYRQSTGAPARAAPGVQEQ